MKKSKNFEIQNNLDEKILMDEPMMFSSVEEFSFGVGYLMKYLIHYLPEQEVVYSEFDNIHKSSRKIVDIQNNISNFIEKNMLELPLVESKNFTNLMKMVMSYSDEKEADKIMLMAGFSAISNLLFKDQS